MMDDTAAADALSEVDEDDIIEVETADNGTYNVFLVERESTQDPVTATCRVRYRFGCVSGATLYIDITHYDHPDIAPECTNAILDDGDEEKQVDIVLLDTSSQTKLTEIEQ